MKFVSKLIATIVFGAIAAVAASPLAASLLKAGGSNFIFFAILGIVALAAFTAPSGRRAWGRGSLLTGALFVAMPLSMTLLSAQAGQDVVGQASAANAGAAAIGATVGAGLMVGASMFVGFILGAIFLVLGLVLVLGGRREVVIVERR